MNIFQRLLQRFQKKPTPVKKPVETVNFAIVLEGYPELQAQLQEIETTVERIATKAGALNDILVQVKRNQKTGLK